MNFRSISCSASVAVQRWQEHADGTAAVLNKVDPHFIRVRTLTVRPGVPLLTMQETGEFAVSPPDMILEEERRIIAGLEVTSQVSERPHL